MTVEPYQTPDWVQYLIDRPLIELREKRAKIVAGIEAIEKYLEKEENRKRAEQEKRDAMMAWISDPTFTVERPNKRALANRVTGFKRSESAAFDAALDVASDAEDAAGLRGRDYRLVEDSLSDLRTALIEIDEKIADRKEEVR